MEKEYRYPVSARTCKDCGMASLVTKTLTGADLDPEEYYYQCLAMADSACREAEEEYVRELAEKIMASFDSIPGWKYPWLKEVTSLCVEYLTLNGLQDAKRASEIPMAVLQLCERELGKA